jgi:hypothetical protein
MHERSAGWTLDAGAARGDRLSVTASSDIAARGRRTSSYTHPRTVYTLVGRGGARRSFARPRARVYSPDAETSTCKLSRLRRSPLPYTRSRAFGSHRGRPAQYTWAGSRPGLNLGWLLSARPVRPATRAPGVPVGMAYVNTSARLPRRSGSKPPFRVRVGPVSCYSRRAITNVSSK